MAGKQAELTVKEYIKLLRESKINIVTAILFGSYAEGRAGEDSDIDVAIISPDLGKDRIEETIMLKKLAEQIDTRPGFQFAVPVGSRRMRRWPGLWGWECITSIRDRLTRYY